MRHVPWRTFPYFNNARNNNIRKFALFSLERRRIVKKTLLSKNIILIAIKEMKNLVVVNL